MGEGRRHSGRTLPGDGASRRARGTGGGDQPLARIRISVERESDGSITGRFTGNVKAVELDGPDVWLTRLHTIRVSDTLDIQSSR